MTLRRHPLLVLVVVCALLVPALAKSTAAAGAQRGAAAVTSLGQAHAYAPPGGSVYQGVATKPVSAYADYVGKHPAVYEEFVAWGQYIPGITADATANRATMMMEITTAYGSKNVITPRQIARGVGDSWLIALAGAIAASGNVTYVRLMAEMNNSFNPYSGFKAGGRSRGPAYSPSWYRQAWRRVTLIMRGGTVSAIDGRLRRLGLPGLHTTAPTLPEGKVAMAWVPLVGGAPDIAANQPAKYFPGKAYVDWVGTDFYTTNQDFARLQAFFNSYRGYPFMFGEYALWGKDDPSWVNQLFGWVGSHSRVQMLIYNDAAPVFWLKHYPKAAAALRRQLSSSRFLQYAQGWSASGPAPGGSGSAGG